MRGDAPQFEGWVDSGHEAYSLYVERPTEGVNEADGPFFSGLP
jgi:hypothetical protein